MAAWWRDGIERERTVTGAGEQEASAGLTRRRLRGVDEAAQREALGGAKEPTRTTRRHQCGVDKVAACGVLDAP
ncbi:hypothetical protein E2562_016728 [Oryza meyeriana var. granulata]|uniref:Uncharacterized protein n=1 Tax=Oryza meyeriana var. granulata TaxID=110450 RepID=A0A6G1BXC0_9ORYZ|nr:hypothetical protein E2562_016728 [Oryza meyeriana var. granulata]